MLCLEHISEKVTWGSAKEKRDSNKVKSSIGKHFMEFSELQRSEAENLTS